MPGSSPREPGSPPPAPSAGCCGWADRGRASARRPAWCPRRRLTGRAARGPGGRAPGPAPGATPCARRSGCPRAGHAERPARWPGAAVVGGVTGSGLGRGLSVPAVARPAQGWRPTGGGRGALGGASAGRPGLPRRLAARDGQRAAGAADVHRRRHPRGTRRTPGCAGAPRGVGMCGDERGCGTCGDVATGIDRPTTGGCRSAAGDRRRGAGR